MAENHRKSFPKPFIQIKASRVLRFVKWSNKMSGCNTRLLSSIQSNPSVEKKPLMIVIFRNNIFFCKVMEYYFMKLFPFHEQINVFIFAFLYQLELTSLDANIFISILTLSIQRISYVLSCYKKQTMTLYLKKESKIMTRKLMIFIFLIPLWWIKMLFASKKILLQNNFYFYCYAILSFN